MADATARQSVCDTLAPGIRVVRFVRPDVREYLYDHEAIAECALYRELRGVALGDLAAGGTLILNCGLIDNFPTAFYRLMLQLRDEVAARNARLLLCCLTPNICEAFALMGGNKTFAGQLRETEARAVYDAKHPAG
ncbi:MAG TPA: hypothetical protein VKE74_10255 [Gemmataceae bacterium]|nr:hypothetical protein [Gemmataceae bacterium]